jgi:uncharacterized protein (TIGR03437 family)
LEIPMLFRCISICLYSGLTLAAATASFPALTYSTYLRDNFTPVAVGTDPSGNVYVAGNVQVDPPNTNTMVMVAKLNPQGTKYLYVRFLGGSVNDTAYAMAVDRSGSVYLAGLTISPDFPVTNNSNFATPPTSGTERSFAAKLDPSGQLAFATMLGGSTNSFAQAVAVNASGQMLVSGTSVGPGFPSTPGVFSVSDTSFVPFLIELDATGSKILFSATGIGGSALTFDAAGNIYMAGTTSSLTYPLTPGTYQPTFPRFQTCFPPCMGTFQGGNQYVTKLDATGTKMIYSTAVSGTSGTQNGGISVDTAGNVYLTGLAANGYPYTVPAPTLSGTPPLNAALSTPALPFLTKLDPAGQNLLYSVPVGGAGVQVDANGFAYVGGLLGQFNTYDVATQLPALASIPAGCLAPSLANRTRSGYAAQVDAAGNVTGTRFLNGSTLVLSSVSLTGSTLWLTASTFLADFPFTPNAIVESTIKQARVPGAFVGAVDFGAAQPPAGTPQVACVMDAADLLPAGPLAPLQLLTLFGTGLGPSAPVSAPDTNTTSLGGVTATFGGTPADLLYASSNQLNLALPPIPVQFGGAILQVNTNGLAAAPLLFPQTAAAPSFFVYTDNFSPLFQQLVLVAINADGSVNSVSNPAHLASTVTVFINGLSNVQLPQFLATSGWSVTGVTRASPFVLAVALRTPSSTANFQCPARAGTSACLASFSLSDLDSFLTAAQPGATGPLSLNGLVYVAP